jgi:hypothetical protein
MTAQQFTPPQAALVAIDIAKNRHEILIEPGPAMRRRRLSVLNNRAEHDRLVATLRDLGNRRLRADWERSPRLGAPADCRRIRGPAHIEHGARPHPRGPPQRLGQERSEGCPGVILHMLRIGATTVYSDPGYGRLNDLQELSKTHDMVSRAKTELWHRLLTHYLPLYFPEAERFQGNSRSDWFLPSSSSSPRQPALRLCRRKRSLRPHGVSSAGRSRRPGCWPISTRRRAARRPCRYGLIHQRSRCSGWFLPRAVVSCASATRSKPKLRLSWSTIRIRSGYASSRGSGRSSP